MSAFPSTLPMPIREGYSFEPENNIQRTDMLGGRARQRKRFESYPTYATLTWIFTADEAREFEGFVDTIGAEWFDLDLLTPWGTGTHEARFMETPQGPALRGADSWEYRAKTELRYRPIESQSSI